MADQKGFIKLDRNILKWRWWENHNTLIVFLTLLLKANYKDMPFENRTIHRGQLVTSLPSLARQCRLSTQSIRTALMHLNSTGEITNESFTKYRIITIVNYDKYQETTDKTTDNQQTTNRQLTDNQQQEKEYKEKKERKKNNKGRSAPDSPSGIPQRGTREFKAKSHIYLQRDEGTVDDIPDMYLDMFDDFGKYHDWRNQ